MKKQGLLFLVLRTLARQLQRQADFLFTLVGEEQRLVRQPAQNIRQQPGRQQASGQKQNPSQAEMEVPPTDWLAQSAANEPPAHWLKRVQQVQAASIKGETSIQHTSPLRPLEMPTRRSDSAPQAKIPALDARKPALDAQKSMVDTRKMGHETRQATAETQESRHAAHPIAVNPRARAAFALVEYGSVRDIPANEVATRPVLSRAAQPVASRNGAFSSQEVKRTTIPSDEPDLLVQEKVRQSAQAQERPSLPRPQNREARPGLAQKSALKEENTTKATLSSPVNRRAETLSDNEHDTRVLRSPSVEQVGETLPATANVRESAPIAWQAEEMKPVHTPQESTFLERVVSTPQTGRQSSPLAFVSLPGRTLASADARPAIDDQPWPGMGAQPGTSAARKSAFTPGREADISSHESGEEIDWPDLPDENLDDDQPWRAIHRDWERQQRLDDEQRGTLWSA